MPILLKLSTGALVVTFISQPSDAIKGIPIGKGSLHSMVRWAEQLQQSQGFGYPPR
ncbi:MAG: hypothetical protein R2788_21765 [Saprospiraceae bacterium]